MASKNQVPINPIPSTESLCPECGHEVAWHLLSPMGQEEAWTRQVYWPPLKKDEILGKESEVLATACTTCRCSYYLDLAKKV